MSYTAWFGFWVRYSLVTTFDGKGMWVLFLAQLGKKNYSILNKSSLIGLVRRKFLDLTGEFKPFSVCCAIFESGWGMTESCGRNFWLALVAQKFNPNCTFDSWSMGASTAEPQYIMCIYALVKVMYVSWGTFFTVLSRCIWLPTSGIDLKSVCSCKQ